MHYVLVLRQTKSHVDTQPLDCKLHESRDNFIYNKNLNLKNETRKAWEENVSGF